MRMKRLSRRLRAYSTAFAVSLGTAFCLMVAGVALYFWQPAPPSTITIATGPAGSNFQLFAQRYKKILAKNGVNLVIVPSEGSLDNLKKLTAPKSQVDVAFVQGGIGGEVDSSDLRSLGSLFYEPIIIAYRMPQPIKLLSELQGKRIAIGANGSGTRGLSERLLRANGIQAGGSTTLLGLTGQAALDALNRNEIDALIMQDDTSSVDTMRKIMLAGDIRLFDFPQADAYVRRFRFLSKLELPPGSLDLGRNVPATSTNMLAATVELIARSDLHPALSDLLIEAAQEVHGNGTLFQRAGEFPAPLEHEYAISSDATRYYQSGKSYVYRHMPFWLASLSSRIVALIVPLAVIVFPALPFIPTLLGWRARSRISRHYWEVLEIERSAIEDKSPENREKLSDQLGAIEAAILSGRIPGYMVNEIHRLRQHILFVRGLLDNG
jgi:TRAP-type uncharacterized transport system substrate-binding protein